MVIGILKKQVVTAGGELSAQIHGHPRDRIFPEQLHVGGGVFQVKPIQLQRSALLGTIFHAIDVQKAPVKHQATVTG